MIKALLVFTSASSSENPQLSIILRDNRSVDPESMKRIVDKIHESGIDVLVLGFSDSGVPHGWSFQVVDGRSKIRPPSEYMIGVGTQSMYSLISSRFRTEYGTQ